MPRIPPSSELRKTSRKLTANSGCVSCRMYRAGRVKMAPATITPEQAPIDWMMTFSPRAFFLPAAEDSPTAMIEIGIAASNTCPIFSPRKAAAAEKITAIRIPQPTDQKVTSG